MLEDKKLNRLDVQIKTKPIPEDIILSHLEGEHKENALNFIKWLRENNLTLKFSRSSLNVWENKIFSIRISPFPNAGHWSIRFPLDYIEKHNYKRRYARIYMG